MAVGKGQFQGLNQGMQVIGAVMPHPLQVKTLQDSQGHSRGRPLTPGAAGNYINSLVVDGHRRLLRDGKGGQIGLGQQPALLLIELRHFRGDFAPIEQIPGRLQTGFPAGRRFFRRRQASKGAGQIRLHGYRAGRQGPAAGKEYRLGCRPGGRIAPAVGKLAFLPGQGAVQGMGDGKAARSQFQSRRHGLLKGHRAIALQGGKPGVSGRRSNRPQHAGRQLAAVPAVKVVPAGRLRPPSQAGNSDRFAPGGVMQHKGGHAAETGVLRQGYIQDQPGGYAGVNGVAALFQDPVGRGGSQIMAGGRHVGGAGNQRPVSPQS